jgi:hypothetical protein
MTHLEVEIEPIVDDDQTYYRTSVYDVHLHKTKGPIRYIRDIYRSPTMAIAVDKLADIVKSD